MVSLKSTQIDALEIIFFLFHTLCFMMMMIMLVTANVASSFFFSPVFKIVVFRLTLRFDHLEPQKG